ncbi:response regulator [Desulfosediminicola flagellatus]|uniref:response regulator n=1 Tax=Desulfosediminicola flagellatus TaxID=2569541 RepID=UPI00142ECD54|nr:response regulator [Desulfosediminicola flagellatus]
MKDLPTILIADDDAIFLGIAAAMIRNMGYPVITALNGVDAVELFTTNKKNIGMVLLDINMPEMNGVDAFQHIRTLCQEVKVVIVSGCLNDTKREQLSPLSPTAYIDKPISFDALSGVLSSTSPG